MTFQLPNFNALILGPLFCWFLLLSILHLHWTNAPNIAFIISVSAQECIERGSWHLTHTIHVILMHKRELAHRIILDERVLLQHISITVQLLIFIRDIRFLHCPKVIGFAIIKLIFHVIHLLNNIIIDIFHICFTICLFFFLFVNLLFLLRTTFYSVSLLTSRSIFICLNLFFSYFFILFFFIYH